MILLHWSLIFLALRKVACEKTINDLFNDQEIEYRSESFGLAKDLLDLAPSDVDDQMVKIGSALRKKLGIILEKGNEIIPDVSLSKIIANNGQIPERVAQKMRKRGVLIVRDVVPRETIHDWRASLVQYIYNNNAFPKGNQTVYEIYWSKAQVQARQHANMAVVQKALLSLWHLNEDNEAKVNLSKPLTYVDRLRIRQPGDNGFNLPLQIDGGGIERWLEPTYRQVYRHILNGDWPDYDPFEADYRSEAIMKESGYANGYSFFRAFQGWLTLSPSGPGSGTLRVLPLLKEATAYWILRPFMSDVPRDLFPGCYPAKTLHITEKWHQLLADHLVSIPDISPGDTVWWHPDTIHTVEKVDDDKEPNSVLYIPVGPDCRLNRDYSRRMRHSFVLGTSPPDFPDNDYEVNYIGKASINDLTAWGREASGFSALTELNPSNDESDKGHSSQCNSP